MACLPVPSGLPRLRCPDTCQPPPGEDPTLTDGARLRDDVMASWPGRALWSDGQPVMVAREGEQAAPGSRGRREGMRQARSQLPRLSAEPASEQPEGQEPGRSGSALGASEAFLRTMQRSGCAGDGRRRRRGEEEHL